MIGKHCGKTLQSIRDEPESFVKYCSECGAIFKQKKRVKKMPQVPVEIQQRLAKAGAKLMVKYGVSFDDMAEYTMDISTILFDYMDVHFELTPDDKPTLQESGLCCMAAHAAAQRNNIKPWSCVCPCHRKDQ